VMIDLDTLRTGLGSAETSTGQTITAGQVRRLACTAGIVPVVLGARSEVLDLGRTRRLFSPAQRKALAIRDRTCRAEGWDIARRSHRPQRRAAALLFPSPPCS